MLGKERLLSWLVVMCFAILGLMDMVMRLG